MAAAYLSPGCGVERRLLLAADCPGEPAAVDEDTPGKLGSELGQESGNRVEAALALVRAASRKTTEQADRIRMPRVAEDRLCRAFLNEPAGVEHADPIANPPHDGQVVADEENTRPQLLPEPGDEVEHFRLDRRVEARRRLVQDEQGRIGRQRHCDDGALLHSAGKLVGVPAHHPRRVGDLHTGQHLACPLESIAARSAGCRERFRDLVADPDRRIQGRAGVLVDHRHCACAVAAHLALRHAPEVDAADADGSARHAAVPRQVAHDSERCSRLAAAGLAHEPIGLTCADRQRHAAKDAARAAADVERDLELVELERRRRDGHGNGAHRSKACVRPSAIRFTPTTRAAIARAGKKVGHQ